MSLYRFTPVLLFVAASAASGQTIPATAPTTPAVQATPQQYLPPPAPPAENRAHVVFSSTGLLSVGANNSSLNQILRDISRATGMKITGGVTDERVFGDYGPADPSTILATLLKGTGSNMMIVLNGSTAPVELILTPRNGGPSPPSPNAGHEQDHDDLPPRGMPRAARGLAPNDARPQQPLPQQQATPAPATAPADSTTEESPNGVKTPQQIYDQLMKMQQKQQQQQTNPAATPPVATPQL